MPTFDTAHRFERDYASLTDDQKAAFKRHVRNFVEDLQEGRAPRKDLRVKGVQGANGVFELSWANNGRATFEYGDSIKDGMPHVIWRRVGTHDILKNP